jgi:branched-chain amino acid transport system permease protein
VLQATANGIILGAAYAIVALGFVLLYNNTKFFNFAHGDFLTLGAYLGYTVTMSWDLPWYLGVAVVIGTMLFLGFLTERTLSPLVRRRALLTGAIATLGLGLAVRAIIQFVWGPTELRTDPLIAGNALHLSDTVLTNQALIIIGATALILAVLFYVYRYTFIGIVVRATAEDPQTAQLLGVRTGLVVAGSFAISAAMAGVAGMLLAPEYLASLNLGYAIVFKSLVGAMVGGFGSLVGAVIGSVLVGVLEVNAALLISPDYRNITVYVLLILLLIIRPAGLLGTKLKEKV